MTNEEVAELLDVSLAQVTKFGVSLGVPDDTWTVSDVFAADEALCEDEADEK